VRRLPTVLSQEEVAQLINSAPTPFYRILLMTLYATGARCAEAARLQVHDIDSRRMIAHIRGGKGRKDRDGMLSPVLLSGEEPEHRNSCEKHLPRLGRESSKSPAASAAGRSKMIE